MFFKIINWILSFNRIINGGYKSLEVRWERRLTSMGIRDKVGTILILLVTWCSWTCRVLVVWEGNIKTSCHGKWFYICHYCTSRTRRLLFTSMLLIPLTLSIPLCLCLYYFVMFYVHEPKFICLRFNGFYVELDTMKSLRWIFF